MAPADPGAQAVLPFEAEAVPAAATRLADWQPAQWPVAPDWQPTVARFLASEAARRLGSFMSARLAAGAVIYPPRPFQALALTPLASVKVVIVGQDPYHGPGQAEGLAFSVAPGMKLPPSLRNIFKELAREVAARDPAAPLRALPVNGSLVHWARQGVLLLNTCLTVEDGQPASHANQGWEVLTDSIIKAVLMDSRPTVFMLWGAQAQKLAPWVAQAGAETGPERHLVLAANHPSPLSALRPPQPFLGCGHFGRANEFLQSRGVAGIEW